MSVKSVLIIGGSGYLGYNISLRLRDKYRVTQTYRTRMIEIPGTTPLKCYKEDEEFLKRILYNLQPHIIIYCAGSNSVELNEDAPRECENVHADLQHLSQISTLISAKLIFISNCYVFDGVRGNYKEKDMAFPATVLGKCKLSGESTVRGRSTNHALLRLSPLIGRGNYFHRSVIDQLRINLDRGNTIQLSDAEYHSFTTMSHFLDILELVIERGSRNDQFHVGGLTRMTTYELAKLFAKRFGYDADLIQPGVDSERHVPTEKSDYSLNSTNSVNKLKVKPLLIEECFDLIEKELIP